MSYEFLLVEKEGGIATITLNRPDKLNALVPNMRVEIRKALEDADADDSIRVIIITGAGRAFCAGAEVSTVHAETEGTSDDAQREKLIRPARTPWVQATLRNLKKPTICALNGVAVGAGLSILIACDVVIASDQAKMRIGFTRMGLAPIEAVSYVLPRRIGAHRTLELVYTNDLIDAKEMDRIGLVNKVVPAAELMKTARETAKKMFQIPPLSLALSKKCVYDGIAASTAESHAILERYAEEVLQGTEDTKEAQKSFMEKREPVYKGK